jgi:hypothetical protein
MLLSEKVEVKLCSTNIKHFENLGYKIPRHRSSKRKPINELTVPRGTCITVFVKDLPKGSHIKVKVQCDYCPKIIEKPYFKYIEQNEKNTINKDCCAKCRGKKTEEYMSVTYGISHNSKLDSFSVSVSEKNREDILMVKEVFDNAGYSMLSEYINYSSPIDFICSKHMELGVQTTSYCIVKNYNSGCKACRYEKISKENCYMWKGGITDLYTHLRTKIDKWKMDSFAHHNFKCVITGEDENLELHHLYNFYKIVEETLRDLKIPVLDKISKYTPEEIKRIEVLCLEKHYKYGFGVPLVATIHREYHSIYGNKDNSKEQFEKFKQDYINKRW